MLFVCAMVCIDTLFYTALSPTPRCRRCCRRDDRGRLPMAAVQIPLPYLPWAAKHRPAGDVDAMLAQAERALELLPRTETRMT
jgi:hypothetical protein